MLAVLEARLLEPAMGPALEGQMLQKDIFFTARCYYIPCVALPHRKFWAKPSRTRPNIGLRSEQVPVKQAQSRHLYFAQLKVACCLSSPPNISCAASMKPSFAWLNAWLHGFCQHEIQQGSAHEDRHLHCSPTCDCCRHLRSNHACALVHGSACVSEALLLPDLHKRFPAQNAARCA